MGLSNLSNIVIPEESGGKVSIGSILRINVSEFRDVTEINPIDTTNIHDIFGDGSAVATYRLNGDANDLGGRFNGSPTNLIYDLNGKYGKQAVFDGSGSRRCKIPEVMNFFNVDTSISFWVDSRAGIGSGVPISRGYTSTSRGGNAYGWCVFIDESNGLIYLYRNVGIGFVYVVAPIPKQSVYHVAITYKRSTGLTNIYINGVLSKTEVMLYSDRNIVLQFASDTHIGITQYYRSGAEYSHYLNASLSQVRIFNRVLIDEEVLKLYAEKRFIIPVTPDLTSLPIVVNTVYNKNIATIDTFFKDVKDITYDYTEENITVTREYATDIKIKNIDNNIVYTCIKPNQIGALLLDKEYFRPTNGLELVNNVLASANGKDDKNYLVTEIESVKNTILNINDKNVNGYKYVAKIKDSDTLVVENREPIFTGYYEAIDKDDARYVLKDNTWYKSIPSYSNILKNSDFSDGFNNWTTGYRTSGSGTFIEGTPSTLVLSNNTVSLGNKPSSNIYNTFIQQEINILKEGYYNLTLEVSKTDVNTGLGVRIYDTTFVGRTGNTDPADILSLSYTEIQKVNTKVWLRPKDKYLVISVGIINASDTNYIFKNLALYKIDEPYMVKQPLLSFLGRFLYKNGVPIDKDSKWCPPKVMQEDTLINGKLITTGNRVWKEIGTVYINQRLVIKNPFGNENWKDTDVKAYIWHPITKRWESSINLHYNHGGFGTGLFFSTNEEGIILISGNGYIYENDNTLFGGTAPYFNGGPSSDIQATKVKLIITYLGKTKQI